MTFKVLPLAAVAVLAIGPQALAGTSRPAPPTSAVARANAAARIEPQTATFAGAIQKFAWIEGGLYQVYAAPGRVTDIVLEPGEALSGPGPIAAGDTVRWVIGDTVSGEGEERRVHILIKPTQPGLATNLVINTSRRTYYVELRASAATYMASVSWSYPQDGLLVIRRAKATTVSAAPEPPQAVTPLPTPTSAAAPPALNFDYRLTGDKVVWRPQQVFDDGAKVYLVFSALVATGELPPLFLVDPDGKAELVNYRIDGRMMIVDRLFERAELRLGDRRKARKVRIERQARTQ